MAETCLLEWYRDNAPYNQQWMVANTVITPDALSCPLHVMIPKNDSIVHPLSAMAFAKQANKPTITKSKVGHIGMMTSRHACTSVWDPAIKWILSR